MSRAKRVIGQFATKNTSCIDPVTKHKIGLIFPVRVHHADADEPDENFELPPTSGYIPIDEISSEMLAPGFLGESQDDEAFDGGIETGYGADPLDLLIAQEEAEAEYGGEYTADPMEHGRPEDELIHFGQGSSERAGVDCSKRGYRSERDDRRGPRQLVSRRRQSSYMNSENHCPKYGRQDYRHQLPRIKAKEARREAEAKRHYLLWLKQFQGDFITVCGEEVEGLKAEPEYSAMETEREQSMWDWYDDIAYQEECAQDRDYAMKVFDDYEARQRQRHEDDLLDEYVRRRQLNEDGLLNLAYFDDWDDSLGGYPDWDDYDGCCRLCNVVDDFCDDRLGDSGADLDRIPIWLSDEEDGPYDGPHDIFRDYGLADSDMDTLPVGHSSRPRFTGRYPLTRGVIALPF